MPDLLFRRTGIAAAALLITPLAACGAAAEPAAPVADTASPAPSPASTDAEFERLEEEYDARLGVYAYDTGSEETIAFNADDRFAFNSTFKVLAVGALLQDRTLEDLEEVVHFTEEDLVNWSPITEQHVDTGMSLREVSDAAVRYSDNTAANLLFEELGGPEGFEAALREIGDDVTNSDRIEPDLSSAVPGDDRDTSTPRAMATSLGEYTLGATLAADEREFITDLLVRNTTGDALIRAGVPDDWKVGDKTGNGGYGSRNDIALLWPPEGDPILLAVMSSRDQEDAEHDDALIADSAAVVVEAMG
jgi:beta-lactamase class A